MCNPSPRAKLSPSLLFAATLLALPLPARGEAPSPPPQAVMEELCGRVEREFYDRHAVEGGWRAACGRTAAALAPSADPAAVKAAADAALAGLRASHTARYTPDEVAYYELLDIFSGGLKDRLKDLFPGGEVTYAGIGMVTREVDGRVFVNGVYHGGPADRAGVLRGDEVVAVEGAPYEAVRSFAGREGQTLRLAIRRVAGGPTRDLEVVPERIRPNQMFHDAMRSSMRVVEQDGMKLGYVRIWSYARRHYQETLIEELWRGRLKDADGLILDLRGGWGGAQPDYADVFVSNVPTTTFTNRQGRAELMSYRWPKPVVVVIDGGTRSGKEILAFAFQRNGIPLVGTPTAGAVLAGRAALLGDRSLLVLAVLDVHVDGARIEGRGVRPDVPVAFDLPYAGGHDPQLTAAQEVLARRIRERAAVAPAGRDG